MALVVKGKVNINEFIDLSKSEKLLPSILTPVKSVMVSKVDKIMVHENESLSEVNLLKGVKLIEGGYVYFLILHFSLILCHQFNI